MLFKYILPIGATQLNYSMRTGWLVDLSILEKDWLIKTWVIFHQVTEMESFFGLVSLPSPSFSTTAEHFHHLKKTHFFFVTHYFSGICWECMCHKRNRTQFGLKSKLESCSLHHNNTAKSQSVTDVLRAKGQGQGQVCNLLVFFLLM